jgi:hypothetical protein
MNQQCPDAAKLQENIIALPPSDPVTADNVEYKKYKPSPPENLSEPFGGKN